MRRDFNGKKMAIFQLIVRKIADFIRFEDFSNLTKHQIFKRLSQANCSQEVLVILYSGRKLRHDFNGEKKSQLIVLANFL